MLLLLFIAAFATDLGAWYRQGSEQQRAADVGTLNGIAAYDRVTRAEFASSDISGWDEVTTDPTPQQLEMMAFDAAVDQIQSLLETSGLTFSAARPAAIYASDPNPTTIDPTIAAQRSEITLTADDGTLITIVRTWAPTGVNLDGVTTFSRVIEITISNDGEQFFSQLLRDAPTINRTAQSVLENCGAACDNEITINPPFVGFEGTGNGDGFAPLLFDRDENGEFDEVWAVNHHSFGGAGNGEGQIICVLIGDPDTTGNPCPGGNIADGEGNFAWRLTYRTGNRPIETFIDGKIYFTALDRDVRGANNLGIACFDVRAQDYCANEFVAFWEQTGNFNNGDPSTFPSSVVAHGPFEHDNRLYIFSQDGQVACTNLNLTPCTNTAANGPVAVTGATLTSNLPTLNGGYFISNGEQQLNDAGLTTGRLILTQNGQDGLLFRCLDLTNGDGVVTSCGEHWNTTLDNGGDDNLTFTRFDTNGNDTGVCVYHIQDRVNGCVDWSAGAPTVLSGINDGLNDLRNEWGGDTFTWTDSQDSANVRTFFAGGNSNHVGCWSWQDAGPCSEGGSQFLETNNTATGGNGNANPYAFDQISDRCLLGLGHEAVFFSFDPVGLGACTDVTTTNPIFPCDCDDANAGSRWGTITIPPELTSQVTRLQATVSDSEDFTNPSSVIDGLRLVDLLATNGELDLTSLNDLAAVPDMIYLTLEADTRLVGGEPVFTEEEIINLSITSAPTLTR